MTLPPGAAAVVTFVVGLIFGSFANVCIHRIPSGGSVITPRSRCPRCGGAISWHDNIPVLSWIWLRARCRRCGERIGWTYPLVEAAMGAGFLGCYLLYGVSLEGLAAAWLYFTCVVLWAIDARHFILPDALTLTGIGAGLLLAAARGISQLPGAAAEGGAATLVGGPLDRPVLPLASLAGAAAGAAIPLLARGGYRLSRRMRRGAPARGPVQGGEPAQGGEGIPGERSDEVAEAALQEGMGLGDVKMLSMVGAFLGPRSVLITILAGSVTGCLVVIPWLMITRRGFRTPIPFGPFLAFGAILALFAGEDLAALYGGLIAKMLS